MIYSRRQMVQALAGVMGYLIGERTTSAQTQQQAQSRGLTLVLDGMDPAITVMYHGKRVAVTAQEVFDALNSPR